MSECTDLKTSQAACLALGLQQTKQNRLKAISKLRKLDLVPIHFAGANPLLPSLISRTVQESNPFMYIKYAKDNDLSSGSLSSPILSTSTTLVENKNLTTVEKNKLTSSSSSGKVIIPTKGNFVFLY